MSGIDEGGLVERSQSWIEYSHSSGGDFVIPSYATRAIVLMFATFRGVYLVLYIDTGCCCNCEGRLTYLPLDPQEALNQHLKK